MSQTLSLYRLQQIDSLLDRIKIRLQAIQAWIDDDSELQRHKQDSDEAAARLNSIEQSLQKAEKDVQSQIVKIEQTQSSLYNTKTHSPKELLDLQNDVAALKRYLVILEDRQIEVMQESETAAERLLQAKEKLEIYIAERQKKENELVLEKQVLLIDLERVTTEHQAASEAVSDTDIQLYNQLRLQRRGLAVAVIKDNSCGACGSSLSLALIQSIRSAIQMVRCPSCDRILYGS